MTKVAVIKITDYPDGAVESMVSSFVDTANGLGHQVAVTSAERDHMCACGGCCGDSGCGDDDCLCTFSCECVDPADTVVFAFSCDADLRMSQLKRIAEKSVGKCSPRERNLMVISCSPSFDDSIFAKVVEFFREVCSSLGWVYAGDALVEGLPDACQGGDPISKKKAASLAKLL